MRTIKLLSGEELSLIDVGVTIQPEFLKTAIDDMTDFRQIPNKFSGVLFCPDTHRTYFSMKAILRDREKDNIAVHTADGPRLIDDLVYEALVRPYNRSVLEKELIGLQKKISLLAKESRGLEFSLDYCIEDEDTLHARTSPYFKHEGEPILKEFFTPVIDEKLGELAYHTWRNVWLLLYVYGVDMSGLDDDSWKTIISPKHEIFKDVQNFEGFLRLKSYTADITDVDELKKDGGAGYIGYLMLRKELENNKLLCSFASHLFDAREEIVFAVLDNPRKIFDIVCRALQSATAARNLTANDSSPERNLVFSFYEKYARSWKDLLFYKDADSRIKALHINSRGQQDILLGVCDLHSYLAKAKTRSKSQSQSQS